MKSEAITSLDWGRIKFFLGEVFANFSRNAGMQVTAIGTVTVTIVLLGLFLYGRQALLNLENGVLNQITIKVFLQTTATPAQSAAIQSNLRADPRIAGVTFVPKAQGFKEMRARLRDQIDTSQLLENPLPDAYRVRVHEPGDVPAAAKKIRSYPGVASVEYAPDVVTNLLRLSAVAAQIGIVLIVLLVVVASVIISNTIRLTVFARRREIGIMQLVGATNSYIRGPFICEGLVQGALGAAVAIGLLAIARYELLPRMQVALPFIPLSVGTAQLTVLTIELLAVGVAVGSLASWISVGRYLRT